MKYWEDLLIEWRKRGRDGLTIPFIIGSKTIYSQDSLQDVKSLFEDIIINSSVEIYLSYCPTINDLILGVRDKSKIRISGSFIPFNNQPQNVLFITKILNNLGEDVYTIGDKLAERYSRQILNREFSINGRKTGYYTADKIKFILDCKANETTDNTV